MQSLTVYNYACDGTKEVQSAVPLFTRDDIKALSDICRTIPIVASLAEYFPGSYSDGGGSTRGPEVVVLDSPYVTQPPPINGRTVTPLTSIVSAPTAVSDQTNIPILSIGCPNGPSCIMNLLSCGLKVVSVIIPEVRLFLCGK
jgi:hypothetical protein